MLINGMIGKRKSKVNISDVLPPQYDHLFEKGQNLEENKEAVSERSKEFPQE